MENIDSKLKLALTDLGTQLDKVSKMYPEAAKSMQALLLVKLKDSIEALHHWSIASPLVSVAEKHNIKSVAHMDRALKGNPAIREAISSSLDQMMGSSGITLSEIFSFAHKVKGSED